MANYFASYKNQAFFCTFEGKLKAKKTQVQLRKTHILTISVVVHSHKTHQKKPAIVQTISVCLHFCMKQNSLPEKGDIIGTGRTYINLNFAGRFPAEIV